MDLYYFLVKINLLDLHEERVRQQLYYLLFNADMLLQYVLKIPYIRLKMLEYAIILQEIDHRLSVFMAYFTSKSRLLSLRINSKPSINDGLELILNITFNDL